MQTKAQRYGLILLLMAALFLAVSATKPWAAAAHGSAERFKVTLFGVSRFTSVSASRWDEHRCAWTDQAPSSACVASPGHAKAFKALAKSHWLVFLAVFLVSWGLATLSRGRIRRAGRLSLIGGLAAVACVLIFRMTVKHAVGVLNPLIVTEAEIGLNAAQFAASLMLIAAALLLSPGSES
jgi:hypothetical protein